MAGVIDGLNKRALFRRLHYEPHPGQWEIHDSDAARRVVACGVRWGKTKSAAMEAVAGAVYPWTGPMPTAQREREELQVGWVVGPTYDIANRVFREVCGTFLTTELEANIETLSEHRNLLRVWNLGGGLTEVRAKSADSPVSLLGEGLRWLVLDEASRVKPDTWERFLQARLVDKRGWALLISTPKGKNYFYDLHRRGTDGSAIRDDGFRSWNMPSWTNPRLSQETLEETRLRIPEAVWRQEYGAEFVEGAGQVFRNVRDVATGNWRPYRKGARYWAGLDLAQVQDYTVLVVVEEHEGKLRVAHADRFHRISWDATVDRVKVALADYGRPLCYVDSTGAGSPVFESLMTAGVRAEAYPFTVASKAALVQNGQLAFEKRAVELPRPELCPEAVDEFESFEFTVTDAGNVKSGAPPGMHDDWVCACLLALWGGRPGGRTDWTVSRV